MRLPAIILRILGRSPAPARPSLDQLRAEQERALAARRADRPARQARARKGHATRWTAHCDPLTAVNSDWGSAQNVSAEQWSQASCHPKSDPRLTDVTVCPVDAHQKRPA